MLAAGLGSGVRRHGLARRADRLGAEVQHLDQLIPQGAADLEPQGPVAVHLQNHEGPCLDCFSTGRAAVNQDLALSHQWPRFAPMALAAGFCAVHAMPMRLRDNVIGALNVFAGDRLVATDDDLLIAQALADASTIAILQNEAVREAQVVANQLNGALTSRIAIEQAKGILAERAEIDMQEAFSRLRRYARDHNRQLSLVATELINGTLPTTAIANLSRHGERELTK